MEIKCFKKDLALVVDKVARIISSKPSLPALSGIYIEAEKNKVILKGTNLEFGIENSFVADVLDAGTVLVPASILQRVLKTIKDDEKITLKYKNELFVISTRNGEMNIKTLDKNEFPKIPQPDAEDKFTVPVDMFISGIKAVSQSASLSVIKPELSSVYIYSQNKNIFFVATDQFRLAEKVFNINKNIEVESVLIPVINANEIVSVLEGFDADLDVYIEDGQIGIKTNNLYLTSRIIDGSFPDYRAIIPENISTKIVILKEDFQNLMRKMQIFSDKFGKVTFKIDTENKKFTAISKNADLGEVTDSPDATISGESIEISFNHKYLLEALTPIKSDSIELRFSGVGKPLVVKGVADDSFTYLVMPMNK